MDLGEMCRWAPNVSGFSEYILSEGSAVIVEAA